MYQGIYNNKLCHKPDLTVVIERAHKNGIEKIICTSGSLEDAKNALDIAKLYDNIYITVGCHPTRSLEFESNSDDYLDQLSKLIAENINKVVAVGECGLDYDRLHFCPKETQLKYFEKQLVLAKRHDLPVFLHCRNCHSDFIEILERNATNLPKGAVVHSFTGTEAEMMDCVKLAPNIYIGINGCSLKTEENIAVARQIPQERLLIETDAPWCEIKPSHASCKYVKTKYPTRKKEKYEGGFMVKGRNEPCTIVQVLEVLAAIRNQSECTELAHKIYQNTEKLFFPHQNVDFAFNRF